MKSQKNYFQDQRNHDVAVRGMRKDILLLDYFGKAKTDNDKISFPLSCLVECGFSVVEDFHLISPNLVTKLVI